MQFLSSTHNSSEVLILNMVEALFLNGYLYIQKMYNLNNHEKMCFKYPALLTHFSAIQFKY